MQTLRRDTHVERLRVDELLRNEPRVRVGVRPDRVVPHVFHAAGDGEVVRAEADRRSHGGDRGHGAGAHALDREPRHRLRQPGEHGDGAAEGEPLVAGLRRRGDRHVVDAISRNAAVALHQPDERFDSEVIRSGACVHPLVACATEGGANSVDEIDVGQLGHIASWIWCARPAYGEPGPWPRAGWAEPTKRLPRARRPLAPPAQTPTG